MEIHAMGERIRDARSRLGLTQANLADALQVSGQAVSKWERGENAPDVALLPDLAALLGVTTDRLLGTTAPAGPTTHATVVFTDLRGFVKRVAGMDAADLATLLNAHFYELTEVMLRHDGVPVKYMGDASLCFFAGPGHEGRALEAVFHAKELINEDMGMGLSSGEIFLGRVGHPLHATLDILGETVNNAAIAERLSKHAESDVVATRSTVEALGNRITAVPVGQDDKQVGVSGAGFFGIVLQS